MTASPWKAPRSQDSANSTTSSSPSGGCPSRPATTLNAANPARRSRSANHFRPIRVERKSRSLSSPTSRCPPNAPASPIKATMESSSWEEPEHFAEETTEIPPVTGCERDPFYPSLELQPTTKAAYTPTGLNASLVIPQTWEDADTLATAHMKKAVVTLPEGFALNPSSGVGLGYCTERQFEEETPFDLPGEGIGCPSESKVGYGRSRNPRPERESAGLRLRRPAFPQPLRQPAHPLRGRQGALTRDHRRDRGQGRSQPGHGAADDHLQQRTAGSVQQIHPQVQPGRDLAALEPRSLWHLHRRSAPDSLLRTWAIRVAR